MPLRFLLSILFVLPLWLHAGLFRFPPDTTVSVDGDNSVAREAAQVLIQRLQPVTGGKFEIVDQRSDATFVLTLSKNSSLKEDGFRLDITPEKITLTAQNSRALFYGIYYFLEEEIGYLFLSPEFVRLPPKHAVALPPKHIVQEPAFAYREIFISESDDQRFALQNGLNGRLGHRTLPRYNPPRLPRGRHIFNSFTPFELLPEERYHCNGQLRYSDPFIRKVAARRVDQKLHALHPALKDYIYLQHQDINSFCPDDGDTPQEATAAFLQYGTYIARHTAKAYRHHHYLLEAYQWSRTPPKAAAPLPDNLSVMYSTIEADFARALHAAPNKAIWRDLDAWQSITDNLIVWHYTTNFGGYFQPHPNLFALAEDIQSLAKLPHVKGLFLQGCYETPWSEFSNLRIWLFGKLLWHPDRDPKALIRTFCNAYYGGAGEAVFDYIMTLHSFAKKLEQPLYLKTPPTAPYLREPILERLEAILDRGYRNVKNNPLFRAHLEEVYANLDYVRLLNSTDKAKRQKSKKRFLAFLASHPDITHYAEGAKLDSLRQIIAIDRIRPKPPEAARGLQEGREWLDFQEYTLKLCCTKIEQDPSASDKIAATMPGSEGAWGFQLDLNTNLPKGKWDIYASVKVTLDKSHTILDKGRVALFFGIHPTLIKGAYLVAQMPSDRYKEIKIGTIDTTKTEAEYLWLSPPQNSVVAKLWLDRIFAVRRD